MLWGVSGLGMPGGGSRPFPDTFYCDESDALFSSHSSSKFPYIFSMLYSLSPNLEGVVGGEEPLLLLFFFSSISSDRAVHNQPSKDQYSLLLFVLPFVFLCIPLHSLLHC